MTSTLIQVKQGESGSYVTLPTPSTYKINYEDLDNDSYRSVLNGNLVRNRIKPRGIKLEVSYRRLTEEQVNTIASAINTNQKYYCRLLSPAANGMVEFVAYTSKYQAEMIEAQVGGTMSFNIIQSEGAAWQL